MIRPHRRPPFASWFFPALGAGFWSFRVVMHIDHFSTASPNSVASLVATFLLLILSLLHYTGLEDHRPSRFAAAEVLNGMLIGPATGLIGLASLVARRRLPAPGRLW